MWLGNVGLSSMICAETVVHAEHYNPMLTLKALSYFGDGDLAELPAAVRKRLSEAAAEVGPESIPRYEPRPGLVPASAQQ